MIEMSVAEYVAYRKSKKNNITRQAICKAIREKHRTPGIKKTEFYGGTYILYVDKEELDNFLVSIKKPSKLRKK